jgi:hypothetical protein
MYEGNPANRFKQTSAVGATVITLNSSAHYVPKERISNDMVLEQAAPRLKMAFR